MGFYLQSRGTQGRSLLDINDERETSVTDRKLEPRRTVVLAVDVTLDHAWALGAYTHINTCMHKHTNTHTHTYVRTYVRTHTHIALH